jgi:RNA polymerase sigma-70 factor (ECF subfamily)
MVLPETEHLLREAGRGDAKARDRLLELHRPYLRRMVAVRLDRRLAARVDPSDVVQDAMLAAAAGMDDYFERRPLAFVPWLRGLAAARVNDAYRRHVRADRRSVSREYLPASEPFVERLVAATSSPSAGLRKRERAGQVRVALDQLPPRDREILELRYLEGLSTADAADTLGITESAAKVRLLRAMQRLRDRLSEEDQK